MRLSISILCLCTVFFAGCDTTNIGNLPPDSLEFYIASAKQNGYRSGDDVIACAAGGNYLVTDNPVAIFFYPPEGSSQFEYWETDSADDDPTDLRKYKQRDLGEREMFQGYLRAFVSSRTTPAWGIVTFLSDNTYHTSNPILIKAETQPTELGNSLITVSMAGNVPTFTWANGLNGPSPIYFEVVSTFKGDLLSGTYTTDQRFTYNNFSNVTLNIKPPDTSPVLPPASQFTFTVMGVSADNWVDMYGYVPFSTQ